MYQLYINKDTFELKLSSIRASFKREGQILMYKAIGGDNEILHYNENYKFCKTRNVLLQYARNLKEEWIEEAMNIVEQIENIKI